MKQNRGMILFFLAMTLLFILVQVWHAKSARKRKTGAGAPTQRARAHHECAVRKVSDDSTRVDSVTYSDEVMRISYTLTKVTKDEIDSEEFTKNARAIAASAFCNEKGLGQFVKSGLSIDLLYKDSTSSPIVNFQIGKSDCL
ncbi:hypothetical protein V5O39_10835 [Pseudomonas parakoreensis]